MSSGAKITRELVRDAAVLIFPDGTRLVTAKWVTTCDDWRETAIGLVNFGWVHIGPSFRVTDSEKGEMT